MRTPFLLISLALFVFISQYQLSEANCGNGVSLWDNAKCRKGMAPDMCKKNGNRGSSSDEDSDSGQGDSGSDSHIDEDGDGKSDSGTGDSKDLEDDWDPLPVGATRVSGSPATTGSPVTSATGVTGAIKNLRPNRFHCVVTDFLRNISVVLDDEQNDRLELCLHKIEHFLSHSFGLTDVKKAGIATHKLRQCLKKNEDILNVIAFEEVPGFGSIFDLIYVTLDLQADFIDVTITLDIDKECELFAALRNATEGDSEKEMAVILLIEELRVILSDTSLSMGQKKAKLYDSLKAFFDLHVDWKDFFLEIEIEGFGPLGSLFDVCKGHKMSLSLSVVISGSSDSDCSLCSALTEATANTSFTITVRSQIKQFHDKIVAYFASNVDIELRLNYVSEQYYQMIIMEPWMVKVMSVIKIKGSDGEEWGLFYDLTWVFTFCKNSGSCGCLSCGLGVSTPAPSTTVKPASTIPPAVCGNRPQLIAVTPQNTTILTDTLTENYNSWNSSMKLGFNGCFNTVRKAIWDNVAFPTVSSKITECVRAFNAYTSNKQALMNIFIAKWNGKIGQFCACGSG